MHLADRIEHVALQMLDVVQLGELAPIIRRQILIELLERLPPEIIAITKNNTRFAFACLINLYTKLTAVNVFPDPVAI